jgi:hypothetical protein
MTLGYGSACLRSGMSNPSFPIRITMRFGWLAAAIALVGCGARDVREVALLGQPFRLDSLAILSVSGDPARIGSGGRVFAVLVSTDCAACKLSLPEWRAAARALEGSDDRFLLLGYQPADSLRAFLGTDSPVAAVQLHPAALAALTGLPLVPISLRLTGDGMISEVFIGRLTAEERKVLLSME